MSPLGSSHFHQCLTWHPPSTPSIKGWPSSLQQARSSAGEHCCVGGPSPVFFISFFFFQSQLNVLSSYSRDWLQHRALHMLSLYESYILHFHLLPSLLLMHSHGLWLLFCQLSFLAFWQLWLLLWDPIMYSAFCILDEMDTAENELPMKFPRFAIGHLLQNTTPVKWPCSLLDWENLGRLTEFITTMVWLLRLLVWFWGLVMPDNIRMSWVCWNCLLVQTLDPTPVSVGQRFCQRLWKLWIGRDFHLYNYNCMVEISAKILDCGQ